MTRPKDVTPEIWEELKEGTKLYDWFNGDNGEIILDGKVWWLETIQYAETMTDDVHDELEKLMLNKYGAEWLYKENQYDYTYNEDHRRILCRRTSGGDEYLHTIQMGGERELAR